MEHLPLIEINNSYMSAILIEEEIPNWLRMFFNKYKHLKLKETPEIKEIYDYEGRSGMLLMCRDNDIFLENCLHIRDEYGYEYKIDQIEELDDFYRITTIFNKYYNNKIIKEYITWTFERDYDKYMKYYLAAYQTF